MKPNLKDHKSQIMAVVDDAIRKTFKSYFNLDVDVEKIRLFDVLENSVTCRTCIHDEDLQGTVYISIERTMLGELARMVYPPDMKMTDAALESCAMEITNIVCARIKTYFNDHGYNFGMEIPVIVKDMDVTDEDIEVVFSVKDERMVVDIGMHQSDHRTAFA